MNRVIYTAIQALLRLNDRLYGRGASREVLRDLAGEWAYPALNRRQWRNVLASLSREDQ
jgi:hypothetical protein